MSAARYIALGLAALIVLRIAWLFPLHQDPLALLAILLLLSLILALIWFGTLIACYILPFGWRASQAHDHHLADQQGAVVRLLGWVALLILLVIVLFVVA